VIEFYPGQKLSTEEPNVKWTTTLHLRSSRKSRTTSLNIKSRRSTMCVGISKDEAEARKVFEFAKTMGLRRSPPNP